MLYTNRTLQYTTYIRVAVVSVHNNNVGEEPFLYATTFMELRIYSLQWHNKRPVKRTLPLQPPPVLHTVFVHDKK